MDAGNKSAGAPFVFAVCGVKNSGKTTYMEKLIAALKSRGVRLAAVKHDGHEFVADVPGTDSSRMYRAGADTVAVCSETQVSVHACAHVTLAQLISQLSDCELVLVEGGKDMELDKLELVRSGNSASAVSNPKGRIGVATDIAGFLPPTEGECIFPLDDASPLADLLVRRLADNAVKETRCGGKRAEAEQNRTDVCNAGRSTGEDGSENEGKDRQQAMGKVWAVCTSPAKGTEKVNVRQAHLTADWGLDGDAHAGRWHRQVSMLALEQIEAFRARGAKVAFGAFGENLVVSGYDLKTFPVGTRFRCGEVLLELTQIGKECHSGCDIYKTMGECIMPREGVFCRVLCGGVIREGDEITLEAPLHDGAGSGWDEAAQCGRQDAAAEAEFTHFDAGGNAVMVDVGAKAETVRTAAACGTIFMSGACFARVCSGGMKKGDVLGVARIAGIMAAKKTSELIPLCHTIGLTHVELEFMTDVSASSITAKCTAGTVGKTGVEMEALTGVQIALLTIYDMCKAADRGMHMENIRLLSKSGGKSGDWNYEG